MREASRFEDVKAAAARRPHGARPRYVAGCRCLLCRAANSRYSCERDRARRSEGDRRELVSTARVLAHLRELSKAGVGYKSAADAAGVGRTTVQAIVSGRQSRCRMNVERALLGVTAEAVAGGALIEAGPTWKLIDELVDRGFSKRQIARWCGWANAIQLKRDRIKAASAARVRRMYELLNQGKLRRGR